MTEVEEIWRPSLSVPEYEVSSLGRIRRTPHLRPMPNGGVRTYGGKPWLGSWDPVTHRYTFMYKGKTYRVARIVCEAFYGLAPKGYVAAHIDEQSRNNRADNLKWATQKENLNCQKFLNYARRAVHTKMRGEKPERYRG